MKTRFLLSVLLATTVGAAVYASAASLGGLNSGGLGAGSATVGSCDNDGFEVEWVLTGSKKVTGATVTGIAADCAGGALSLTVTGSGGTALDQAEGTVPAGGGSLALTLTAAPDPALVNGVHVVVHSQ